MRQQNGLSLKTQHNSKVWTIVPLEPPPTLETHKKPHLPKQVGFHQLKAKSA
jgi:hypothetical protein